MQAQFRRRQLLDGALQRKFANVAEMGPRVLTKHKGRRVALHYCPAPALFGALGQRVMIGPTHAFSGIQFMGTGYLFQHDLLTAQPQTIGLMVVFFVAPAAASSAYPTVSETFPLEIRALVRAVVYASGIGGVVGPWLLGAVIGWDRAPRWRRAVWALA